ICYLHVGTGKTGSSAIQYAFTKAHNELLKVGYSYPDAAGNLDQVLAGKPVAGNGKRMDRALHEKNAESAIEMVKRHASEPHHLIISCEGFSSQSAASLAEFTAGIRSLGYDLKCLAFFRPQAELVVSSYLQQVKANKQQVNIPLEQYVELVFSRKGVGEAGNWYARAEKLSDIFGKPNLTVKWYPATKKRGPDAVVRTAFDW